MAGIRSFVALPTPEDVQSQIASLIQTLQSVPSDVKWERLEKIHLTLRFLGSISSAQLEQLHRLLTDRCRYHDPFEITYEGIGAFPTWTRPRILWVGVRSTDALVSLQSSVEEIAVEIGLPREDRAFHPHLTIGRVKSFAQRDRLTATAKSLTLNPVLTLCNTVLVVKSELHPAGSRYTVLHSIPLSS